MIMRYLISIIVALALGCGSVQHAVGPSEEVLVDGTFPPPVENQRRPDSKGRCTLPKDWYPQTDTVIARNGGCWVEIEATEQQCREAAVTNPLNIWSEGRCWYWLPGRGKEPQPTSSLSEPLAPVTAR